MSVNVRSRFYPHAAIALAAIIVIAFTRTYYLRYLSDLPPLSALMQVHGLVFTAWLGLFVAQTQLIAARRVDLHMKLGIAAVFLAMAIVAIGLATVAATAATPRIRASGLTPAQASIIALTSITAFAVLVTLGITFRRRASLHKRFMLLAMIAVLGPATARIVNLIGGVGKHGMLVQMIVIGVFTAGCLIHDWRRHRVVHPIFAAGGAVLILLWPMRFAVARSEWWQPVGQWIAEAGQMLIS
ncbi:MAG: hypothetical protein ABUU24_06420 [Variovorax sp.]